MIINRLEINISERDAIYKYIYTELILNEITQIRKKLTATITLFDKPRRTIHDADPSHNCKD